MSLGTDLTRHTVCTIWIHYIPDTSRCTWSGYSPDGVTFWCYQFVVGIDGLGETESKYARLCQVIGSHWWIFTPANPAAENSFWFRKSCYGHNMDMIYNPKQLTKFCKKKTNCRDKKAKSGVKYRASVSSQPMIYSYLTTKLFTIATKN